MRVLRLKSLLAGTILMAGLLMPVRPLFGTGGAQDQSKPVATETREAEKPEPDENDAYLHSDAVKAIGAKLGMTTEQAATAFQIVNFAVLALGVCGWSLEDAAKDASR